MLCQEAAENIELFVLGELAPARQAEMEAHLARCADCRAAASECRRLVGAIRLAADERGPSRAFASAVRSAVAAGIQAERRRLRVRRMAVAVGSAVALLVVGLAVWRLRRVPSEAEPRADGARETAVGSEEAARSVPGPGEEKWRYENARAVPTSIADGIVVRGTSMFLLRNDEAGPRVVAIDAATGAARWRSACASLGYLAADRARVYCLVSARRRTLELAALSGADGKTLWRYRPDAPGRFLSPCRPMPVRGDRVCWTARRAVHMLDARTGRPVWTREIPDEGRISCAVVRGDDLYVVTGKKLHCLRADSGSQSWTQGLQEPAVCAERPLLALAGQRLYAVQTRLGHDSRLLCMALATRRLHWTRKVPWARSLLAAKDAVYLRSGQILALDARDGKKLWACAAAGCGPLTLVDGRVHFVDAGEPGRLVALDQRTGHKAWEMPGILSCDAFTKVGSTGYIKTQDGTVHALAMGGPRRF